LEFDIYNPACPNQPPYSADFISAFRRKQLQRVRPRTDWVKETLQKLKKANTPERNGGFVPYRTWWDVRFMDPAIEPNDRKPRWTFVGQPETANTGPLGLARFSTLRAWLSQWSPDDSNADGPRCARDVSVPLLAIENSADDAVPQSHARI